MAYCMKCGKVIDDDKKYCDEHSPENSNSQQIMPNVSFVAGENQKDVDFTVDANGTVAAQFNSAPVQNNYAAPVKKAPLWMFPVGALAAAAASAVLSGIGSAILQAVVWEIDFVDSEFLIYLFNGQIIPTIVFFVLVFGTVILYNNSCRKNGLEASVMPVYYGGIFYVCRAVTAIVGSLLSSVTWLVLGIISEVSYLPFEYYDAYGVVNGIAAFINGILFIVATFFVFTFIHKKQIKK